jgi:signal transduction histidine kinase
MQEMNTRLQLDILKSNIEALETERKRVAEDLHDEIGGKLSALRLNLAQIQRTDKDEAQTLINRNKEIIDTMITTVRRISHNMMPPALEIFGLANTVEELCAWVNTSSALYVNMEYGLHDIPLDQKKQLALYRIVQELFSNTIRHAQAGNIQLSFIPCGKELQLIYKDDGKGFDPSQHIKQTGMGFRNIESRVKIIKGTVQYPCKGKGFECVISFPAN